MSVHTDNTRLAIALASGIADHLRTVFEPEDLPHAGYRCHDFISAFEESYSVLWRLGLAKGAAPRFDLWELDPPVSDWSDAPFPSHFRLVEPAEIAPILGARELSLEMMAELVQAYVILFGHYGRLDDGRDWFVPAERLTEAMRALAAQGYAEAEGARFRWTERIAPAMQAAGLWTEDAVPLREIEDAEIAAFLDRLTPRAKAELTALAQEPHTGLIFATLFIDKHLGTGWARHFPVLGDTPVIIALRVRGMLAAEAS